MELPLYSRSTDIRTLALGQGCEGQWLLSNLLDQELPDTTWFALGTALHEGYELAILGDIETVDELVAYCKGEAIAAAQDPDIIESASKRAKRTKASMKDDAVRMAGKWWKDVHPDSDDRHSAFDGLQWPPTVEHEIATDIQGQYWLYTTVDAIFKADETTASFGVTTPIVDWKTGSKASAPKAQLDVYAWGGHQEGWRQPEETELGFFWHVDHSKPQREFDYIGDEQVELWIKRTYAAKEEILNHRQPVYRPDWWCNYCRAQSVCPVQGKKLRHTDVDNMIDQAIVIQHPNREETE